eukprot:scaffold2380_cov380-Prasinococcus_capsulatus_cf.AAC.3
MLACLLAADAAPVGAARAGARRRRPASACRSGGGGGDEADVDRGPRRCRPRGARRTRTRPPARAPALMPAAGGQQRWRRRMRASGRRKAALRKAEEGHASG